METVALRVVDVGRVIPRALPRMYFSPLGLGATKNCYFGGPFGVPPPDGWKGRATILGERSGPAEAVPARRAHLVIGKLRYHVVVPQQDAVERPGGRHKLATALGENHALDQGIDRRILDADVVARARRFGRLRAP